MWIVRVFADMFEMFKNRDKKAMELEVLGWWILGIFILVVVIFAIVILAGKGTGALDYIKDMFRFR